MVVLDNKATAASGFQPNAGVGLDAMGREAPALSIEHIARACGVQFVRTIRFNDPDSDLRGSFQEALSRNDLALIIVQTVL